MNKSIKARLRPIGLFAAVALAMAVGMTAANAQRADRGEWIGTWAASPQPVWDTDFVGAVGMPRTLRDQTIRQIVRVSVGGSRLQVEFSNEYGKQPLIIGAAHIALAGSGSAIVPGSDHVLTFSGRTGVSIPPGAPFVSDPVDLPVAPLGSLAISMYLPAVTPSATWHNEGVQTAYFGAGDVSGVTDFKAMDTTNARLFLSEVRVNASPDSRAVITFGDSITDGYASTPDANHRWPDFLAERLHQAGTDVAIVNEGISGDRLLRDRMGDNALARFDRDVLGQPRASTVLVLIGINDIGWPDTFLVPQGEPAPSAFDVIVGYEQLIARAHAHNLRIVGATLTPFNDAFRGAALQGYYTDAKEVKRQEINAWIRSSGAFDGVIDFDAATRDPASPEHMRADFDSGDHLHPQDTGYKAMADAVDLSVLLGNE